MILQLVYYGCPSLCSLALNGFVDSLKSAEQLPGKEFKVLTLSIDPDEDETDARAKRASYLAALGKPIEP